MCAEPGEGCCYWWLMYGQAAQDNEVHEVLLFALAAVMAEKPSR